VECWSEKCVIHPKTDGYVDQARVVEFWNTRAPLANASKCEICDGPIAVACCTNRGEQKMVSDFRDWWAVNHPFDWWKKERGESLDLNTRTLVWELCFRAYTAGQGIEDNERRFAQARLDEIDSVMNDLYRQVREKEAERAKYDRIAHPEDYENLCAGGIPNCKGGATCTSDHK
jgi:hypothetical protein